MTILSVTLSFVRINELDAWMTSQLKHAIATTSNDNKYGLIQTGSADGHTFGISHGWAACPEVKRTIMPAMKVSVVLRSQARV